MAFMKRTIEANLSLMSNFNLVHMINVAFYSPPARAVPRHRDALNKLATNINLTIKFNFVLSHSDILSCISSLNTNTILAQCMFCHFRILSCEDRDIFNHRCITLRFTRQRRLFWPN